MNLLKHFQLYATPNLANRVLIWVYRRSNKNVLSSVTPNGIMLIYNAALSGGFKGQIYPPIVVWGFFCLFFFTLIFPEVFQTFWWYIGLSLMRIASYHRMRNCWTFCPQGSSSINPITPSDKPFLPLYVKPVFGAATFSVSRQNHLLPNALLTSQTLQSILVFFFLLNSSGIFQKNKTHFYPWNSVFDRIFRSHRKSMKYPSSRISQCPSTVLVPQSWRNEKYVFLKAALLSRKYEAITWGGAGPSWTPLEPWINTGSAFSQ